MQGPEAKDENPIQLLSLLTGPNDAIKRMSLKRADETTRRGIKADLDQWRPRKRVEAAQNGHKVSHAKGSSDKNSKRLAMKPVQRELSKREKNRKRVEEQREQRQKEFRQQIKRAETMRHDLVLEKMKIRRVASFGDHPRRGRNEPKRRKRLKTRGERSRRAASVESSRQSGRSANKSHDSGIALNETNDSSLDVSEPPHLQNFAIDEESSQKNWDSSDEEKLRPSIVSYNANSDPDNTIRFREQFRTFNAAPNPPDSASSKLYHKSDGDLLNMFRPLEQLPTFDLGSMSLCDYSGDEQLDSAAGMDDSAVLAKFDDLISQVEKKQADLSRHKSKNARTSTTGWKSEADLMRPGSALEQLSNFADRLEAQKTVSRHKSFAAISNTHKASPTQETVPSRNCKSTSAAPHKSEIERVPSLALPDLNVIPQLSESFRSKLQSWDSSKPNRRRPNSLLTKIALTNWSEKKDLSRASGSSLNSKLTGIAANSAKSATVASSRSAELSQLQIAEEADEVAAAAKRRRARCCFFSICT